MPVVVNQMDLTLYIYLKINSHSKLTHYFLVKKRLHPGGESGFTKGQNEDEFDFLF